MARESDGIGSGLSYRDEIPFVFTARDADILPATLARLNIETLQALQADASLDEVRRSSELSDGNQPWLADLERLEYKINVMLGLMGRLLARDASIPGTAIVRLGAKGLEWQPRTEVPPLGQSGLVQLYVNPAFPQPLSLPGTVTGERPSDEGRWLQFTFAGLSPPVSEWLERLIFRHHRRQIADARSAGGHRP